MAHPIHRRRKNAVTYNYVRHNDLVQLAIDKAATGDFSLIHELLDLWRRPYEAQTGKVTYAAKRPEWAHQRPACSMLSRRSRRHGFR